MTKALQRKQHRLVIEQKTWTKKGRVKVQTLLGARFEGKEKFISLPPPTKEIKLSKADMVALQKVYDAWLRNVKD